MYEISYCIYSVSHVFKKLSSHNQDKWLGWKDWLNKKFCDKFMEMNDASVSQQQEPTTPPQNKNIKELNDLTKAGADPKAIVRDSRFNDKVEILPKNKYLIDFLKQSKFDFGLSSYNEHSQLMKAIRKTLTAETFEEIQEGKFAIDYLLDKQVSEEFVIEDVTKSVGQNQHIPNNKDNISRKALGEAWLAAVKLITQKDPGHFQYNATASNVIKKLYEQDNSILNYTDNEGNNAVHISASSAVCKASQGLLRILEGLDKDCSNQLKFMPNKEGNNALHLAVLKNNNEVVEELLRECTSEQKQNLFAAVNYWRNNILHLAIRTSDQQLVKQILRECTPEQKQNLFAAVNERGNNPIMEAIESKEYNDRESWATKSFDSIAESQDCFDYLKERINAKCIQSSHNTFQSNLQKIRASTPELLKIDQQQLTTVRELIQHNSTEDCVKLLKKAIFQQKEKIIQLVLPTIRSNVLTEDGKSILELVLDIDKIPEQIYMLNLLIDCGVNLNIQNTSGETLLHKIVDVNHLTKDKVNCQNKIIEYLVHLGADVNIQNHQGNTPLHIELTQIMRMGDVMLDFRLALRGEVVKVEDRLLNVQLLLNNANPTIQNCQGDTPLDIIIKTGDLNKESHIKIFQLLLDGMIDLRVEESDEVVQNRFDLIPKRYSKMQYPTFDILYYFAEYIATQHISCKITKEQCQFLIQSPGIAKPKALKQVAYIFKACVVLEESAIPTNIRELMKYVTLPSELRTKSARNVGEQKKDIKDESKEEESTKDSEGVGGGDGLQTSSLLVTILSNSSGENTYADLGNVFAQFVPGSNDIGGDHTIPEIKIGGGDSCIGDSIVPYNHGY